MKNTKITLFGEGFNSETKTPTKILIGETSILFDKEQQLSAAPKIAINFLPEKKQQVIFIGEDGKNIIFPDECDVVYAYLEGEQVPYHAWYPFAHLLDFSDLVEKNLLGKLDEQQSNFVIQMSEVYGYDSRPFKYLIHTRLGDIFVMEAGGQQTVISLAVGEGGSIDREKIGLYDLQMDGNILFSPIILKFNNSLN